MSKRKIIYIYIITLFFSSFSYSQKAWIPNQEKNNTSSTIEKSNDDEPIIPEAENIVSFADGINGGSVNKNGKLSFSVPLSAVATPHLNWGLSFYYNGNSALEGVKYTNQIRPTGVLGLGWNIENTAKIIADTKGTGGRGDDTFYLQEGGQLYKFICTYTPPEGYGYIGNTYKTEAQPNWKIKRYDYFSSNYWQIIKEDGTIYTFGEDISPGGNTEHNAYEKVVRWGEWIGDNRDNGGSEELITAWNLVTISTQWDEKISFFYDTVDRAMNTDGSGSKHIEASYLNRVESSSGEKIIFNYNEKFHNGFVKEYYEPHIEATEPDAYQEFFETKYLNTISYYNKENVLTLSHQLEYEIQGADLMAKRYLTKIKTYNANNESLKPQEYVYMHTGDFKGSLQSIKNSSGSTVSYEYENKFIYNNSSNRLGPGVQSPILPQQQAANNFLVTNNDPNGQGSLYTIYTWDGLFWKSNEINTNLEGGTFFITENYFGFFASNLLKIYSLSPNGKDWDLQTLDLGQTIYGIVTYEDSIYIMGLDIMTLWKYDGKNWILSDTENFPGVDLSIRIRGPYGNYFKYSTRKISTGTNDTNYIITKTEDNNDIIVYPFSSTDGSIDNLPNTYIENSFFDEILNYNTSSPRNNFERFYVPPSNFLSFFSNSPHPTFSIPNGLNSNDFRIDNAFGPDTYYTASLFDYGHPNDLFFTVFHINRNTGQIEDQPLYATLENETYRRNSIAYFNNYLFIGNKIYKKDNLFNHSFYDDFDQPMTSQEIQDNIFSVDFIKNNNKIIINRRKEFGNYPAIFYSIIEDGTLFREELLGNPGPQQNTNPIQFRATNSYLYQTYNPFSDTKLVHIKDNRIHQDVYDIVIKQVTVNNNDQQVHISYTYEEPFVLPNDLIQYGKVSKENKGAGNASIGTTISYYNNGIEDIRYASLLEKQESRDTNNQVVSDEIYSYQISNDIPYTENGQTHYLGNYIQLASKTATSYFQDFSAIKEKSSTESYQYNDQGLLFRSSQINSSNRVESYEVRYAYEESSLQTHFIDQNKLTEISTKTNKIDNDVVNIARTQFEYTSGKLYPKKLFSSPSENQEDYRVGTEITKINHQTGAIEEVRNNDLVYQTYIQGYNNNYNVAIIENAQFNDAISELDITYEELQSLSTENLKAALMLLYDRLPNAMINLSFYNANGAIINSVDQRKEEIFTYYDDFGRVSYTTDGYGNVLQKNKYNFIND